MTVTAEFGRAQHLEEVLKLVQAKVPAAQRNTISAFVLRYYGQVDPEDLAERAPADLYGAALSHWNFARRRDPAHARVRVFNPSIEEHGWQSTHTIIEIVNDDMPFLVDSVTMEVNRHGLTLHLIIHPIVAVVRDAEGTLVGVADDAEGAQRESLIHVEVDRIVDPAKLDELAADIVRVLDDVRAAVEDWKKMRDRLGAILAENEKRAPPLPPDELAEGRAFLSWLADDHFTFLGYRCHELVVIGGEDALKIVPGSSLGILREGENKEVATSFAALPPEVKAYARRPELLVVTKSTSRSTVHRPGYLDYIAVKRFDAKGEVSGEDRFLGLFTSTAYSANPAEIPLLRRKIANVVARAGLQPGSHAGKALINILATYPRDELFQTTEDDLLRTAVGILHLGERQRFRLFVRRDPFERFLSCLIYAPRENYTTELRQKWQQILVQAFNGTSSEFNVYLTESVLARILITVRTTPGAIPDVDVRAVEARLVAAARRWADELKQALIEALGEARGNELFRQFGEAFPAGYREDFTAREAVPDIQMMARLSAAEPLAMSLYRPLEAGPARCASSCFIWASRSVCRTVCRCSSAWDSTCSTSGRIAWCRAGCRRSGCTTSACSRGSPTPRSRSISCTRCSRRRSPASSGARSRMTTSTVWCWRRIFRQPKSSCSEPMRNICARSGFLCRSLSSNRRSPRTRRSRTGWSSCSRRDSIPTLGAGTGARCAELVRAIEAALAQVDNLSEDRVLRQYLALVMATTRTNFWRRDAAGRRKSFVSFKFDPAKVPGLPEPKPMFEIFVYSPRFEGVHLRGGKVARGGLRWSDRPEDFRTEVLGLVKAQMVKNTVIVPVGSKGGFVLKRAPTPADRDAYLKEGIACYQDYLRGLLDITDNRVGEGIVPPPQVKRHDPDDPYLVVAADKGTATFSDYANGISKEYGFWLGDAFASGGSAGYDHKAMGITARGAWESVKRHFREMGIDTQTTDFTVAGIGDMSGDVFGNGMLLSRHIKLVAAFDHRHVFLDPTPDPAASFAERERMFKLPRSSWADYDSGLISAGGGVYPRSAKSIAITPQAKTALAISADALTPAELVNAILKAPVDLIYNGGIGTYVKASAETHAQVGDRANDAVRVNGRDLRCKVVCEGGNLGCTQLGRIEYALAGGRIFTDAIDNSAGVDTSDHEVNIKILLGLAISDGELTEKQRNALLATMTDDVAALVLRDNYFQTQALSVTGRIASQLLDAQQRFIEYLEKENRLNRELEYLPDDEEFTARRVKGLGLTSPERAVALAYSKIWLYEELLASVLPDDPWVGTALSRYFPKPLREPYAAHMARHPLKREIIVSHVTNSMINRVGSTFVHRVSETTGSRPDEIVRAYLLNREIFGFVSLWQLIEALDNKVDDAVQSAMLIDTARLIDRGTMWFLRSRRLGDDMAETIAHFAPRIEALASRLPQLLDAAERSRVDAEIARYEAQAVPHDLAARVATFDTLYAALDIIEVAEATQRPVELVADVYFDLATRLGLAWLRDRIAALPGDQHWQMLAKGAMQDDLSGLQRTIAAEVVGGADAGTSALLIGAWQDRNRRGIERAVQLLGELRMVAQPDAAMLSVALRELRNLG